MLSPQRSCQSLRLQRPSVQFGVSDMTCDFTSLLDLRRLVDFLVWHFSYVDMECCFPNFFHTGSETISLIVEGLEDRKQW